MFYITIPTKYGKSYWTGHAFGARRLAKSFSTKELATKEISVVYNTQISLADIAMSNDVEYKIYWQEPQIEEEYV